MTHHCIERFHERFRPALEVNQARAELRRLIRHGRIDPEPPEWLAGRMRQEADAYLVVGEDLVLPLAAPDPLDPMVAKTCISRGGISAAAREHRNVRKRRRRAARRGWR